MASLAWLSYHKLVGVEYAKTKNPELLPYVLEKAQHQLLLRKHLLDIHDFLQERHIPYVVLKGIPLNQQLYGNKMLKYSGDIDILVDKKDFLAAHTCLLELGYELQSPLQVETVMQHEKRLYALKELVYRRDHVIVELHRQMSYLPELTIKSVSPPVKVMIEHKPIPVLAHEENFVYLCLHAAHHVWQRLIWLTDIAKFYQKIPLAWPRVLEIAQQHFCIRPLLEAKALLQEKFAITLPAIPHDCCDKIAVKFRLQHARYSWSPAYKRHPYTVVCYLMFIPPKLTQKYRLFVGLLLKSEDRLRNLT